MKYQVVHSTEYQYTEAVPVCHNELHLRPREHPRQICLSSNLTVDPLPSRMAWRRDYFGNPATLFTIQEPHERLTIVSESIVDVSPPLPVSPASTPPWEEIRDRFALGQPPWWLEARQFVLASPYVPLGGELFEYATPSFPLGRPWLEGVLDLTRRIYQEFVYDPRATTISTPVLEVLKMRRGVCQDFAHLQIACLRSLGLPARYVSGYLLTLPPPGMPRLVGADASHAWVSVFCPEIGWVDIDPTNNQIPTLHHITLGWGRDYSDVSPVKGVITGGGSHAVRVSVDVTPLEPLPEPVEGEPSAADVRP
jgi:transglutaminase-like putative cysteine protease